jgi:hypothetical protein
MPASLKKIHVSQGPLQDELQIPPNQPRLRDKRLSLSLDEANAELGSAKLVKRVSIATQEDVQLAASVSSNTPAVIKLKKDRYLISPNANFLQNWNLAMLGFLGFTAIVTPFEVCFLSDRAIPLSLTVANLFVDTAFWTDMLINFNLCFVDGETKVVVNSRKKITMRYLKGWFVCDFVSTFPFDAAVGNGGNAENLKLLQIVRLVRLAKLMRLLRANRVVRQLFINSGTSFAKQALWSMLVGLLVFIHVVACLWRLLPTFGNPDAKSWMDTDLFEDEAFRSGEVKDELVMLYSAAFTFGLKLVQAYDLPTTRPVSNMEIVFSVFASVICTAIYTYVLGMIVEIVTTGDPSLAEYKQTFDTMADYMDSIGYPIEKQRHVRHFLSNSQDMMASNYYTTTLNVLSPALQGELAAHTVRESLLQVPFLNPPVLDAREQQEIIPIIARTLRSVAFCGQELIHTKNTPVDALLIIEKGLVGYGKGLLGMKDVLQREFICKQAKTRCMARAVTHTTCLSLGRIGLEEILENGVYPVISKAVRTARIRVLLHESMHQMLQALRAAGRMGKTTLTEKEVKDYKTDLKRKAAKKNVITKLREKQITQSEAFTLLDIDRNGSIDKKEFLTGLLNIGVDVSPSDADAIWPTFTLDAEGTITIDEWKRFLISDASVLSFDASSGTHSVVRRDRKESLLSQQKASERVNVEYFNSVLHEVQASTKLDNEDKLARVRESVETRVDLLDAKVAAGQEEMRQTMSRLEKKLDQLLLNR